MFKLEKQSWNEYFELANSERDISSLEFSEDELWELKNFLIEYFDEKENDEGKRCSNCHFAYLRETGYSNWTVEGCDINCSLKLNPSFPVDKFYDEDITGNTFANKCNRFAVGSPTRYNVEDACPFE